MANINTANADVLVDNELFVLAATKKAKINILNCSDEFEAIHLTRLEYPYIKIKNMGIPYITRS
ncbi:hypothetical protein B4O85_28915 [Pseudomonas azotoformans]|uniref:Uncharacterized protein n=1 Tax=Pseudomonas azotoformans TaxID=47878 RepID=A0A4Q0HGQ3_PSEAZ|nr:hypothetical protein B4O85_28915 [Pseudomonas azotoformans]